MFYLIPASRDWKQDSSFLSSYPLGPYNISSFMCPVFDWDLDTWCHRCRPWSWHRAPDRRGLLWRLLERCSFLHTHTGGWKYRMGLAAKYCQTWADIFSFTPWPSHPPAVGHLPVFKRRLKWSVSIKCFFIWVQTWSGAHGRKYHP